MSDTDNKFNEELEDELGKELDSDDSGSDDLENDDIDDFTVKVHREEYVIKRRFYDKDKALEAAESLRLDKRNLVEDNIDGEIIASELEDEEDEKVDWNKLVDAGLEFYPPIADAAEKKPGEKAVALTKLAELQKMAGLKEGHDLKELEKTMVVKKGPTIIKEDEKVSENESEPGSPPEPLSSQDEEPPKKIPEKIIDEPEKTLKSGTRKSKYVLIGLIFVSAAILFYIFMKPVEVEQSIDKASDSFKTSITKTPVAEIPVEQEKTPVAEDAAPVSDDITFAEGVSEESVVKKITPAGDTEKIIEKEVPVKKPDPIAFDHYPYTVHVSSYQTLQKAVTAVGRIKKKGFDPFTGLVSIPGKGQWYRVYIGYNGTYQEAVSSAAKVKQVLREGASAAKAIWAIQIGKAATEAELAGLIHSLGEKGYYLCKIPVARDSDVIRLLAGAYKTEQETVSMVNAFKKDGFEPLVVKR